ncbi:8734_t:CDS:2 [Diversispora eburnea]|uniref:8734_t:CDS:1 n=1 Tax=Diversispora eburnea TaxID=1213867 RepID=A0A9N9G7A1_9GLOM|nr:8734_t:CDS:2 [Diversispora eburnea]
MKNKTDTTSRTTPRTHEQLPHFLQQVLPDNYTYIIKSYKELDLENFPGAPPAAFDSTFYVNIASAEAIEEWRTAFHNKTGTIFRITRADKVKGIKVIYHKDFHCRHADIAAIKYMQKTYAQKAGQRRSRNTNCQCLAKIRLEKSRLILSHPCEIHLLYNHNHPLEIFNLTPPTPSMISSTTSDESGKSTPQHNLEFDSIDIYGNETAYIGYPSPHDHNHHFQPQFTVSPTPTNAIPVHFSNNQFIPTNHVDSMEDNHVTHYTSTPSPPIHHQYLTSPSLSSTSSSSSSSPSPSLRLSLKRSASDLQTQEIISVRKRRSTGVKRHITDMPDMIIGLTQQI